MAKFQQKFLQPYQAQTSDGHPVTVFLCMDCGLDLTRRGEVAPLPQASPPPNHPNVCDAVPCDGHPSHLRPWYITLGEEVTYE